MDNSHGFYFNCFMNFVMKSSFKSEQKRDNIQEVEINSIKSSEHRKKALNDFCMNIT